MESIKQHGAGGAVPTPADKPGVPAQQVAAKQIEGSDSDARLVLLLKEISDMATELRTPYVSIAPRGSTALATQQIISGSATYKGSSGDTARRLCYLYAVPCAWDLPRCENHGPSSSRRTTSMLAEDFAQFADVIDRLITLENESYAVVLAGRASRAGAGLSVQAGITGQVQIIDAINEKTKGLYEG